jgi:hypothetical protein
MLIVAVASVVRPTCKSVTRRVGTSVMRGIAEDQ